MFVCPATRNNVRSDAMAPNPLTGEMELKDLQTFALNKNATNGYSYENFTWWRYQTAYPHEATGPTVTEAGYSKNQTRKTESRVISRSHRNGGDGLKLFGQVPGPSKTWLVVDGDNNSASNPLKIYNNYPDKNDNHGEAGANAVFADGHVEWVRESGNYYLILRELTCDEGVGQKHVP